MRKICCLFAAAVTAALTVTAQDSARQLSPAADTAAFHPLTLGQVVVISGKPSIVGSAVGAQQFQRFNRTDISHALDLLPGVSLTAGRPLPAGVGPFRIIVPGEKKPARNCFQVTAIAIKFAKD